MSYTMGHNYILLTECRHTRGSILRNKRRILVKKVLVMMRICSEEVDISIQRIIMMMLCSLGGATLVSVTVINTYKSTFIILTTISRDPINYNIV